MYKGIHDVILRGDIDAKDVGKKTILPSSYIGSVRYMINNYQDVMAIYGNYKNPDLFITFTCNIKWPEIIKELKKKKKPSYKPEHRADIIYRVFKKKLNDMLSYIKSSKPFGKPITIGYK